MVVINTTEAKQTEIILGMTMCNCKEEQISLGKELYFVWK